MADIYKFRWEIELFFKWITENLKIRSSLGHSMNAVDAQIFVALCVYLLVAFQKLVSRSAMGIQAVLRLVQLSLFQRKANPWPISSAVANTIRPIPRCLCG